LARSKNRLKFTKSSVEKLVPPKRPDGGAPSYATWFDTERPGLALRLSSEGRVSFFLTTTQGGRSQRISLGQFPRMTVEQARVRAREVDAEIVATGRNPNQERRERRQSLSLGELFERYRADYLVPRGKPTGNADQYWRDYLAPWSSKTLADISPEMAMALHQDIPRRNRRRAKLVRDESRHARTIVIYETKQKVSEGMANRVVGFLSALYGWASRTIDPATAHRYYTGINPAALVTKYSESPGAGRPLSDEEMKRFLEVVAKLDPYWRDFFLALAWTGARLSNVCAMRWDQLDLEVRIWSIPSRTTKTHRPYRVALSSPLVALLALRQRGSRSEWVFPSKACSGHLEEPKKVWYAILKSARIKDLRLHDLRTTAASWGANANVGPFVVSSQLGHAGPSMTARYTHVSDTAKRAAADAIAQAMLEKAGLEASLATAVADSVATR
jgi:integrase